MKATITSGLVLLIAGQAIFGGNSYISSRYQGKYYESCVTEELINKIPPWDPLAGKPAPVSPERAIQMARLVLEEHVPQGERSMWLLKEARLEHFNDDEWPPKGYATMGEQKWYYVVRFWNKNNPEVAALPTPPAIREKQEEFNIIVLMSGEACKPVPRRE